MNWIVAVIVTALLWQRDWGFALVAGIVVATLLGIEGAICDVQWHLQYLGSDEARVPMAAMRDSVLGQKVITPRTITLWKLKKALEASEANDDAL
jgi:uncharacterized membrane protein YGL010W